MKKVLFALPMVVFAASVALAVVPDSVTMKAKNGNVTFDHKEHSAFGSCKVCHGKGTPAKLNLDKDAAHKLCVGCHTKKKAGPLLPKCIECHKK